MVLYQEGRCHSQRLSPSSVLSYWSKQI
jgi:hypothetical protein